MLAWTSAGAVARPRTLQIRLDHAWPDRVRAGAPSPSRGLTTPEFIANLRWFTDPGPRGQPVDALVLSGQTVATRDDLGEIVGTARALGITHVTLHVSGADLSGLSPGAIPLGVDRCVLPMRLGDRGPGPLRAALEAARAVGVRVDANVPLTDLGRIAETVALIVAGNATSCTFTFPFPGECNDPPRVEHAVAAVRAVVPELDRAGVPVTVKGLPACALGDLAPRTRRSRNRWYVDADHQQDAALLFFPEVLAFAKTDACRFCAADERCDGFVPAGAHLPGVPPIRAFEA